MGDEKNNFIKVLERFVYHKNEYEKLVNEGGSNKEINSKYKKKYADYEEAIKKCMKNLI